MAQKMVSTFRRSLSFPNHPSCSSSSSFSSSSSSSSSNRPRKSLHIRSVSLPCRSSHPLISQLRDGVADLKSWAADVARNQDAESDSRTSAWLCDGLSQLKAVQDSLDDLLQLPKARESLLTSRGLIDKFLDDFLRFLDAYGTFQMLIISLKEQHSAAQVALKKKDYFKMSLCSKNFRKMGRDFGQLSSSLPSYSSSQKSSRRVRMLVDDDDSEVDDDDDADQIVQVIKDVIEVTASVSLALFNGLSVSLAASRKTVSCLPLIGANQKRGLEGIQEFEEINVFGKNNNIVKDEEELKWTSKKMQQIEDCIRGFENGSEKVLRSLFSTRVSLLNVLTAL